MQTLACRAPPGYGHPDAGYGSAPGYAPPSGYGGAEVPYSAAPPAGSYGGSYGGPGYAAAGGGGGGGGGGGYGGGDGREPRAVRVCREKGASRLAPTRARRG